MKKYLSKIIAQDEAGLQMISACVSKAKVNASEIKYLPKNKIFLLSLERFGKETGNENLIIKSIIKFEFINFCRAKNINPNDEDSVLKLLAINFFKNEGKFDIQLVFDNNKIIELKSEIIECVLEDQNKKNLND